MGIQIKGSNDTISAADGSMVLEGAALTFTNENITGVSTMASAEVTSGDLSVGISTFFVDNSTGKIGIGTISPSDLLTIVHSANSDDGISIVNKNNSQGSAIAQLELSGGDNAHARVQFECNGVYSTIRHDGSGNLGFYTNGSNERLRIESDGDFRLTYGDAGTNYGGIRGWNTTTGDMIIDADKSSTGTGDKSNLIFKTRGSERMRLTNNGDVNITGVTTATAYSTSSGQQIANRNVVHNGDMNINQRDVTNQVSIQYAGYYTVDRWKYSAAGGTSGTWTMVQDTDVPDGQGFNHSLKTDCQVANASPDAGDYMLLTQTIEGFNLQRFNKGTSDAKTMTLSFWAKSTLTGNFVAELNDNDNTRTVSALFQTTTSWKKHVITFPADTTGAFGDDNGASLYLNFWLSAGSNFTSGTLATTWASNTAANRAAGVQNLMSSTSNNFWITGVQLEAGSVATPFEFRDHGDQLSTCQRYFQKLPVSSDHVMWGFGRAESNAARVQIPLNVPLRATPSITCSNFRTVKYDGTMLQSTTTPTVFKWDPVFPAIILDFPSGGTQTHNNVYIVTSDGGTTGLQISSEL